MADDLARRRRDLLWSRMKHPQGNLSTEELMEFMVGTAESILDHIAEEDAAAVRAELAELKADYEMSLAASSVLRDRIRSVCELVNRVTPLPGELA